MLCHVVFPSADMLALGDAIISLFFMLDDLVRRFWRPRFYPECLTDAS